MFSIKSFLQIFLVLVGVFSVVSIMSANQAQARDNYGAIAYSPKSGAIGWGFDYRSRGQAERAARRACRKRGRGCRGAVWFKNACGALATGPNGWGSGWGSNRSLAEKWAKKTCRKHTSGCRVIRWVCTTR